jgi:hypothetical protein
MQNRLNGTAVGLINGKDSAAKDRLHSENRKSSGVISTRPSEKNADLLAQS